MTGGALAAWDPSLKVFLKRSVIISAITVVAVLLVGRIIGVWSDNWYVFYIGPVLLLIYSTLIDDPNRWRLARRSRWYLQSDAVIHNGPEGEARIPLSDIVDIRTRFGWSVVLFLKGGMRVSMAYLPDSKNVALQIRAARERLMP